MSLFYTCSNHLMQDGIFLKLFLDLLKYLKRLSKNWKNGRLKILGFSAILSKILQIFRDFQICNIFFKIL